METTAAKGKGAKKRKKKKNTGATVLVILLAIALLIGGTILFLKLRDDHNEKLRQSIINAEQFHEGVVVSGIDINGMTVSEAKNALAAIENDMKSTINFTFKTGSQTFTATAADFGVTFDTDAVLEEAFSLARSGDLETLQAELEDIKTAGRTYSIDYTVSKESVDTYAQKIAASVDTTPTDATFTVADLGINPETEANNAIDLVYQHAPIEGSEDQTDYSNVDARDYRFAFVEGVSGYGVDRQTFVDSIMDRIAKREYGEVEIPLAEIVPNVTIATIKESLVLRASATTFYGKRPYNRESRVHNLTKASGLMYGTVLQPGDVFSANTILGDRTYATGWKDAPAVIDGGAETEDQAGGGVCQVNTTVYNAVLKANLKIVYRQAHSSKLSYVPGGLDATIDSGRIDFKWENDTASPVYVFTWIDTVDKYIHCEIYGEPFPDTYDSIELKSVDLGSTVAEGVEYVPDASIPYGFWRVKNEPKKGYGYETYQEFMKNGQVIEEKLITKTVYKAHPLRYYVWIGYAGEPLLPEFNLNATVEE